jgi:membrane protein DedA with SNARE-associated domain
MSSKLFLALAWFSVFVALGCVMVGLPLMKRGSPAGLPFVVGFVVLIAATIVFAWFAKRKQAEEKKRLSHF